MARGLRSIIAGDALDPHHSLLAAVIWQAADDARNGDAEAAAWLHSPGFETWADWLDLSERTRERIQAVAPSDWRARYVQLELAV